MLAANSSQQCQRLAGTTLVKRDSTISSSLFSPQTTQKPSGFKHHIWGTVDKPVGIFTNVMPNLVPGKPNYEKLIILGRGGTIVGFISHKHWAFSTLRLDSLSTAPFWCCATAQFRVSQTYRRTRLQNQCPSKSRGMFRGNLLVCVGPSRLSRPYFLVKYGILLLLLFLFA